MDISDAVALDPLRAFIAAVDEGSFSAAGRKLPRAQSVVSQTLANLEAQLGVALRSLGPLLTAHRVEPPCGCPLSGGQRRRVQCQGSRHARGPRARALRCHGGMASGLRIL